LRSTQAALNAARTSPDDSRPRLSASPPVSDADSDSRIRASTDDADDSLETLLGNADPNFQHDLAQCGLSSPWAIAVKSPGSKMLPDDIVNLSAFLITGRTVQYLAWLVLHLRDDPSAVSRQQIDDVLPHLDLARNTLIAWLNHYHLLASGLDAKSAAALAAAAASRQRPPTSVASQATATVYWQDCPLPAPTSQSCSQTTRRRPWTRLSRRCTILRRRSQRNPPLRLTTTTSTPCALSSRRPRRATRLSQKDSPMTVASTTVTRTSRTRTPSTRTPIAPPPPRRPTNQRQPLSPPRL